MSSSPEAQAAPRADADPNTLPSQYEPAGIEPEVYERWLAARAFRALPEEGGEPYVIMMPLPNVTGALHMGHAMDNVMQDLLIRWHRMRGDNSLWMPGTDHAGIATQAVVEKRLLELEGLTRLNVGREGLVERIWAWKEQYQRRIVRQQQAMGCSCDWDRQRFTMDAVCSRAVRWTFFRMFRDGLIYRGTRLVNWDAQLQTAVADDEIVHETVEGWFWHLRYPVIEPGPGEPAFVTVATTRPETMLADTAVACHPDPAGQLERLIAETRARRAQAPARDWEALDRSLAELEARRESHLPQLLALVEMAKAGRRVMLPLAERPIPIILDAWAKPELGSGCVKITPGHDPNDYAVWQRHKDRIAILNLLEPDGRLNAQAGPYAGLDRFEARTRVAADLDARGLIERKEPRSFELGHSDRSKSPIEPYLSLQWFVRMGDIEGGVAFGEGTAKGFRSPGLAQAAIDAAAGPWRSPSGRMLRFHPDADRYGSTYLNWLAEKRDWCISRQLWWGHRIPIWAGAFDAAALAPLLAALAPLLEDERVHARLARRDGSSRAIAAGDGASELLAFGSGRAAASETARESSSAASGAEAAGSAVEILVCLRDAEADRDLAPRLEALGLAQDPDVLDTWFSSGVWPHSTLGWPDPATAAVEPGQTPLGPAEGRPDALAFYYPGSCLVTGRDIITLWVVKMVMFGLYNMGDLPFTEVFIHANILDGKGERMSKSKGNGIDPVDIIERYGADAMRFVLCEMQTGTQDIRLPVQAISPYTGALIDLATARHGRGIFTYLDPETGKEFDVLGTMADVPAAKLISDRFIVGRNFCNKLWNAMRFALLNLDPAQPFRPLAAAELAPEDRWILASLDRGVGEVERQLEAYNPAAAIAAVRDFFWNALCDWYLELIKPRLAAGGADAALARQVLAALLDQTLRLAHPFVPFITEALWQRLNALAPVRGIDLALPESDLLIRAAWPRRRPDWEDPDLEARFAAAQEVTRAIRDLRSRYAVPPARRLPAAIRASGEAAASLRELRQVLTVGATLSDLQIDAAVERAPDAATAIVGELEVFLPGLIDLDRERERLSQQAAELERRIEASRARLGNEAFVTRARPEVVDRERRSLAELETEREGVAARLAGLG